MGGAERVLALTTSYLAERGYEVVVVTFENQGESGFYKLAEGITCIGLNIAGRSKWVGEALLRNYRAVKKLRCVMGRVKGNVVVGFMDRTNVYAILASAVASDAGPWWLPQTVLCTGYTTACNRPARCGVRPFVGLVPAWCTSSMCLVHLLRPGRLGAAPGRQRPLPEFYSRARAEPARQQEVGTTSVKQAMAKRPQPAKRPKRLHGEHACQ